MAELESEDIEMLKGNSFQYSNSIIAYNPVEWVNSLPKCCTAELLSWVLSSLCRAGQSHHSQPDGEGERTSEPGLPAGLRGV